MSLPDHLTPAPDLDEKIENLQPAMSADGAIGYVLWWRELDPDPALASLGGGIMTVSSFSPTATMDSETGLSIPDAYGSLDGTGALQIPRSAMIDLMFGRVGWVSTTDLKDFVGSNQETAR